MAGCGQYPLLPTGVCGLSLYLQASNEQTNSKNQNSKEYAYALRKAYIYMGSRSE